MTNKMRGQATLPENTELDLLVLREIEALERRTVYQERTSPSRTVNDGGERMASAAPSDAELAGEDSGEERREAANTSEENSGGAVEGDQAEKFITEAVQWLLGREDKETILYRIEEVIRSSPKKENNK